MLTAVASGRIFECCAIILRAAWSGALQRSPGSGRGEMNARPAFWKRLAHRKRQRAQGFSPGPLIDLAHPAGFEPTLPLRRAMRYRNLGWRQVLLSASKCRVARLPTYNLIDSL